MIHALYKEYGVFYKCVRMELCGFPSPHREEIDSLIYEIFPDHASPPSPVFSSPSIKLHEVPACETSGTSEGARGELFPPHTEHNQKKDSPLQAVFFLYRGFLRSLKVFVCYNIMCENLLVKAYIEPFLAFHKGKTQNSSFFFSLLDGAAEGRGRTQRFFYPSAVFYSSKIKRPPQRTAHITNL